MFYFQGIFWGLMVGLVAGAIRMGIHFSYPDIPCGSSIPDERPEVFSKVHYLHFAIILAGCSGIVMILVSMMTKKRTTAQVNTTCKFTFINIGNSFFLCPNNPE